MKKVLLTLTLATALYLSSYATVHVVQSIGYTFSPATLNIELGDTVEFQLGGTHNAREVSESNWNANTFVSNGGFSVGLGGGQIIPTMVDTLWYVCEPHADMGMKGIIYVNPVGFGVEDENLLLTKVYMNSAGRELLIEGINMGTETVVYTVSDMQGRTVAAGESLTGAGPFAVKVPLASYTPGVYFVELKSAKARLSKKFFLN